MNMVQFDVTGPGKTVDELCKEIQQEYSPTCSVAVSGAGKCVN